MKTFFQLLCNRHTLSENEAYQLLNGIYQNKFNDSQIAAIIAFYIARPITVNELKGFRKALLDACLPVKLDREAVDVCGTGGDQKNTFNISTLTALVIAACGIPVAKHGNYGSSSVAGSSDILKYLGYQFKTTSDDLNREFNKYTICFIHAPLFHPALKTVAACRKELAVKTFFNLLGPLVNPANINFRYVGVYGMNVARLYNYILQQNKANYCLVHSLDGCDEVSLTSSFKYITKYSEQTIEPESLGFLRLKQEDLFGGKIISEAANIFVKVLKNECTKAQKDVVIINSALAINAYDTNKTLPECIDMCKESIESKKTYTLFKNLTSN